MANDPNSSLEDLIQRELAKLPEMKAPETLVPRVMGTLQARSHAPWWRQPFPSWPWRLRTLCLTTLALMSISLIGAALFLPNPLQSRIDQWTARFMAFGDFLVTLSQAAWAVKGHSTVQLSLIVGASISLLMYAACVGLGTLCVRIAAPKQTTE